MVRLLLTAGYNPNAASELGTPWEMWLKDYCGTSRDILLNIELFLRNGAALDNRKAEAAKLIFTSGLLRSLPRQSIRPVWYLYQEARRLQGLDPEIEVPWFLSDDGGS